jgi:arsenate reductase-like glutaredoxin family protein
MDRVTIYHNPVCSKSRGALDIPRRGASPTTRSNSKAPPDRATLTRILDLLQSPPADLVRKDKRLGALPHVARYQTREQ